MSNNQFHIPPYQALPAYITAFGQIDDFWHSRLQTGAIDNQGEKALIVVIDTAAAFDHPDLPTQWNQYGFDGVGERGADNQGHGHMAGGVIAMQNNDIGARGMAPGAVVVPMRGLNRNGVGQSNWLAKCIRWAITVYKTAFPEHIPILSLSWGSAESDEEIKAALTEAKQAGFTTFAAAGNEGHRDPNRSTESYPAAHETLCISVGALSPEGQPAYFTSRGKNVDIAAFGQDIYTTDHQQKYVRVSGTSFSTPMCAGIGAKIATKYYELFRQASKSGIAQDMMETFLEQYAVDIYQPGKDDLTGAGMPVLGQYAGQQPEAPGGEDPGQPPVDDTPEQPGDREYRSLHIRVPGTFRVIWGRRGSNEFQPVVLQQLELELRTNQYSAPAAADIIQRAADHFARRGYYLQAGKDADDVVFYAGYFFQLYMQREQVNVKVKRMTGLDQNGLEFVKYDFERNALQEPPATFVIPEAAKEIFEL